MPGDCDSPVIILSYAHSGAALIQQAVAEGAGLACTAATGILPACEAAAMSWARIDNRGDGALSRLAASSIRALISAQLTAILAASGRRRWCELAITAPSAARAFHQVFPSAKFVCVHRACPDVISSINAAYPWGPGGQVPSRFVASYPGNSAAALAAYWAWATEQLLEFEEDCPGVTIRLTYEEFTGDPSALDAAKSFLRIPSHSVAPLPQQGEPLRGSENPGAPFPEVPADMIPEPLGDRIRRLQHQLSRGVARSAS